MTDPTSNHIYAGDCLEIMRSWPDDCIDHCIADPPFGIASGRGRSSKRGLGWAFSSHITMQEEWDQFTEDEYFRFSLDWLREVCRVVRPNGNILVFGTFHNIYLLGFLLSQVLERRILNSIVWFKPNAQPNVTARMLTESTEQIIWAVNETPKRAKKWTFNYWDAKEMNGHKQMRNLWHDQRLNVWISPVVPPAERRHGKHPAQKPRALTDRLIQLFTSRGNSVLDPFAGTGVVALSAAAHMRDYVLVEKTPKYVLAAKKRIQEQRATKEFKIVERLRKNDMTLNDIELRILQTVPVPQADELDKVFSVLELVDQGATTTAEIAEGLAMVRRQGGYYADAALALRLVTIQKDVTAEGADRFHVTPLGHDYLDSNKEGRTHKRRFAVLNSPILRHISSQLGLTENGKMVGYPVPGELYDQKKVAKVLRGLNLTGDTPVRRAETIHSWLKAL